MVTSEQSDWPPDGKAKRKLVSMLVFLIAESGEDACEGPDKLTCEVAREKVKTDCMQQ